MNITSESIIFHKDGNEKTIFLKNISKIEIQKNDYKRSNTIFKILRFLSLITLFYFIYILINPSPNYDEIMHVNRTGQREAFIITLTSPFLFAFAYFAFYFFKKKNTEKLYGNNELLVVHYTHGVSNQKEVVFFGDFDSNIKYMQDINNMIEKSKLKPKSDESFDTNRTGH
jgi:hypothetical protein